MLLFAALVPALAFSAVLLWQQYRGDRQALGQRTALSASLTANGIDEFIQSRLSAVQLIAQTGDPPLAQWEDRLVTLRRAYPGLSSAIAVDTDGWIQAASPLPSPDALKSPAANVSDRDYFQSAFRTRRSHVSDAFHGRVVSSEPLVAVSTPIVRDERLLGVLSASIHVETFVRQRSDAFHAAGYEMLLLDRRDRVIHATPGLPYGFLDQVTDARLLLPVDAEPHQAQTRFQRNVFDGSNAYIARTRLRTGWTLVLFAPDRPVLMSVGQSSLALFAVLLLVSLGILAATWLQLRALARGTGRLLDGLRHFALGSRVQLDDSGTLPHELQPVADAIGDLSGRLNDAYAELSQALDSQRGLAASLQRVVDERDQEIADRTVELREAVAELETVASIDALTGALNVRGFRRETGALLESMEYARTPVGAMIIDVDHFKAYNDRYGHPAGDTVLKRIVGILQGLLRGPGDVIARVGGEEFAVLLRDADAKLTVEVAERLCSAVWDAAMPHASGVDGRVTISIGVAAQPSPEYMDRLLSQADEALYRAKRNGRNRVMR